MTSRENFSNCRQKMLDRVTENCILRVHRKISRFFVKKNHSIFTFLRKRSSRLDLGATTSRCLEGRFGERFVFEKLEILWSSLEFHIQNSRLVFSIEKLMCPEDQFRELGGYQFPRRVAKSHVEKLRIGCLHNFTPENITFWHCGTTS